MVLDENFTRRLGAALGDQPAGAFGQEPDEAGDDTRGDELAVERDAPAARATVLGSIGDPGGGYGADEAWCLLAGEAPEGSDNTVEGRK
jgi:hypothetical protein